MSRKEEYKLQNEQFLEQLRTAEGIKELPCGILYRVLEEGRDGPTPRLNSVVSKISIYNHRTTKTNQKYPSVNL